MRNSIKSDVISSTEAFAKQVQHVCLITLKKTVKFTCWETSVVTEPVIKDIERSANTKTANMAV